MDKELSKNLRDAMADPENEIISAKARSAVHRINNVAHDEINKLLFEIGSPVLLRKLLSDTVDSLQKLKHMSYQQTNQSYYDQPYYNQPSHRETPHLPVLAGYLSRTLPTIEYPRPIFNYEFYDKQQIPNAERIKFFTQIGANTNLDMPGVLPFRKAVLLTKLKLLFPTSFNRKDVLDFLAHSKIILTLEGTDPYPFTLPDYFIDSCIPVYNFKLFLGAAQSFRVTVSSRDEKTPLLFKDEFLTVHLGVLAETSS